ncbi:hypothetical protein EPO33_03825 [Patescibacteria group bacterium]|nr:MAG: hypothetical protein EPO33_03825 [Patescibacteria group bacterium]
MATLVVGCLAGAAVLAFCGRALYRYLSANPESVRARTALARRGIAFRTDALSACHGGLIVSFAADPGCEYCERCGDSLGESRRTDFWTRYREAVAATESGSADPAWDTRDAIRVLRDEIIERQGPPPPQPASARR